MICVNSVDIGCCLCSDSKIDYYLDFYVDFKRKSYGNIVRF